jgi:hypothetical protein
MAWPEHLKMTKNTKRRACVSILKTEYKILQWALIAERENRE